MMRPRALTNLGLDMNFRLPTVWLAGYTLRARLYSIIVFLGLLPVLGVLLALGAFEIPPDDQGAPYCASRGTIHLEHINGLVYAIVMELRGIYMSADWKSAEPFAQKLTAELADLQETAHEWKQSHCRDNGAK